MQLQGKFQLDLLLHQKHAICWMVQMEHLPGPYGINSLLWEQRSFPDGGHYYYSPALGQIRLGAPPPHMRGGLLCDEQGLGKTVEVLGLIMATLPELKQQVFSRIESKKKATYNFDGDNYYDVESSEDDDDGYHAHTTLIIVPTALVAQWLHEIEKAVGKNTLTASLLVSHTGDLEPCLPERKPVPKDEDDNDVWERIQASDIILTTYDALDKNQCRKILQNVQWGRVVLDEMQEIRSSTTQIAKNCEKLQCDRRWMLSGTPIFSGIEDLRGELNFLRLEPFGAGWEDGFFDFAIQTPWNLKNPHAIATLQILGLVALRRSKDMTIAESGLAILDLKPMTVEFIPVPQSHSERALYCWLEYLVACELTDANEGKKKEDNNEHSNNNPLARADAKSRALCLRLLRETCITPMLLNGGLGAYSQLDALNQLHIRHNRREQMQEAIKRFDDDKDDNEDGQGARKKRETMRVMSCDQALRFLTQHQQTARTKDNFVTDVAFGGGRGVTNRDRAMESAEDRYKKAQAEVTAAEKVIAEATKKRATANWHMLLEKVTCGYFSDGRQHKFSALWKWRRLVCVAMETKQARKRERRESSNITPPSLLTRGWRPSKSFSEIELYEEHPDFVWAHPHAVLVQNIPKEVTLKELAHAMRDAAKLVPLAKKEHENYTARLGKLLEQNEKGITNERNKKIEELQEQLQRLEDKMEEWKRHDSKLKLPTLVKVRERKHLKGFWKAIVQYENEEVVRLVMSHASRSAGAPLKTRNSIPHIKALIKAADDKVSQAEAEIQVLPSIANKKQLAEARKEAADIGAGLRVMAQISNTGNTPYVSQEMRNEYAIDHPHVLLSKAMGLTRGLKPQRMSALVDSMLGTVEKASEDILRQKATLSRGKRVIQQLQKAVDKDGVSAEIQQLSAFGTLDALSNGEVEKTMCPICLGQLGSDDDDSEDVAVVSPARKRTARNTPKKKAAKQRRAPSITMISCGHFYCR
jgi:hypothetical protein